MIEWIDPKKELPIPHMPVWVALRSLVDDRKPWVWQTTYMGPDEASIMMGDWDIYSVQWDEAEVYAWTPVISPDVPNERLFGCESSCPPEGKPYGEFESKRIIDAFRNCITEPKCRACPWTECSKKDNYDVEIPVDLAMAVMRELTKPYREAGSDV